MQVLIFALLSVLAGGCRSASPATVELPPRGLEAVPAAVARRCSGSVAGATCVSRDPDVLFASGEYAMGGSGGADATAAVRSSRAPSEHAVDLGFRCARGR